MHALLGSGMRKGVEATRKIASQVVVSVIATGCAALVTNAFLKPSAGPAPAPATVASAAAPAPVLDPQAAVGLMRAAFTEDGIRVRGTYPAEFQVVFGPSDTAAALGVAETKSAPAQPKLANKPATAPGEACSGACGQHLVAAVLPPVRPADLTPSVTVAAQSVPAAEAREHIRLLGVPLPHFVPSGEEVVKTVASWGGAIAGLAVGE